MKHPNENNDSMRNALNVTFSVRVSCPRSSAFRLGRLAVYVKYGMDSKFVFVLNAGRMLSLYSNFSTQCSFVGKDSGPDICSF